MPKKSIGQVLQEHSGQLMSISGVVGTAEGIDASRPCILVMVAILTPELRQSIPSQIEGYPVKVEETGEFRALDGSE